MKEVAALSLPLVLTTMSVQISTIVGAYMMGKISDVALGATMLGGIGFMIAMVPIAGLATGVQVQVSRKLGAGAKDGVGTVLATGLLIGVGVSLICAGLLYVSAGGVLPLFARRPIVIGRAIHYLDIRLLSAPAFAMTQVLAGFWMGANRPFKVFWTLVAAQAVAVAMTWFLVLGPPHFGVAGAAMGAVAGEVVGLALQLCLLWLAVRRKDVALAQPTWEAAKALWRVGGPLSVRRWIRPLQRIAMVAIMGMLGPAELVVGTLLMQVHFFVGAPVGAFGRAAATLAAGDLGAGRPRKARARARDVATWAAAALGVVGLVTAIAPAPLLHLFLANPALVELGRLPLRIIAMSLPFMAASGVLASVTMSVGTPRSLVRAGMLLRVGLSIALAWALGVWAGWGLVGVFLADAVAILVRTILAWQAFRRPRWTRIEPEEVEVVPLDEG